MPVEVTTNIPGLNQSYPLATDGLGEGDDHLRLLKRVLKTTFPNIDQPITVSAAAINAVISNPFPFPVGGIILWSGATNAIPTGWTLCNGVAVPRSDGTGNITPPDLRDRFVVGAGGSGYTVGATGGSATHTHAATVAGHVLTVGQMPHHAHGVSDPGHSHGVYDPGHSHSYTQVRGPGNTRFYDGSFFSLYGDRTSHEYTGIQIYGSGTGIGIQGTGGNEAHSHGITVANTDTRPPYYALAYIMKI